MADEDTGAAFGYNPRLQRQGVLARLRASQRDINTLPDPLTYSAVAALLGEAPDELGFSALHPQRERIKNVAEPAFAASTAAQLAPLLSGLRRVAGAIAAAPGPVTGGAAAQRGAIAVPTVNTALNNLKTRMLEALTPAEGAEGSLFKADFAGSPPPRGSPTLSGFKANPNAVYPVYHGAREFKDEPLRPMSQAHNDVSALFGQRADPRALAYGTSNPEIARLHAYGVSDLAPSPNLRAYVGRGLPEVYAGDFSNYDISALFKNLSREDKDRLFDLYGVYKYGLTPRSDRSLEYLLRSDPERLAGQGVDDISNELTGLKASRLEQMPKNYIQRMTDLAGFKPSGAPIQKEMYQMMLTDPDEALRLEQLIPLKGNYAKGGLAQVKECSCHGR